MERQAAARLRPHDWAFGVVVLAVLLAIAALVARAPAWSAMWTLLAVVAAVMARRWSRRHPGPMPHAIRWVLLLPRGGPQRLHALLEPRPGERILEIGPGVGVHSLPTAQALAPGGTLDVLDVQEAMLDVVRARAAKAGVDNVRARQGDAQRLPFDDGTFDAAFICEVLGEIPDGVRALREVRRVLKPGGRLVVGEMMLDPDYVSFRTLERLGAEAGLRVERRTGGRFAFLARLRPVT
jgi:SAM-dependent methyltransferase